MAIPGNGAEDVVRPVDNPAPLETIQLPPRGQVHALAWFAGGVLFYAVVSFIFFYTLIAPDEEGAASSIAELIGLGATPNPSIAVLVIVGFLVTVAAFISVVRDVSEIRREEADVEWLIRHKRRFAQLVLAPTNERDALREAGEVTVDRARIRIETLVDDRVRRVMFSQGNSRSAMVPVEELRVIAQTRTARLGGFARYSTSLLLLLAVLGTFAGVKTALPSLIQAVTAGGGGGAPFGTSIDIVAPLQAVADAFGANALALIGAIAVGIMAHGVAVGRRNLLERLEFVSAEYIYGGRHVDSADPLRMAVEAMHETVERVRETSGSLLGIESGLSSLGSQFAGAFESLDARLTAIIEQQDQRLHERTSHALEELRERVSELTEVVDANTRAYSGLVDRVGERSEETRHSLEQIRASNELLARGLEGAANLGTVAGRVGEEITTSISHLQESTGEVRGQVAALGDAVGSVQPALQEARELVATAASQFTEANRRQVQAVAELHQKATQAWVNAGRDMERQIARLSSGSETRPVARADRGAAAQTTSANVVQQAAGIVVGGAVLYVLYTVAQGGFWGALLGLVGLG